MVDNWSQRDIDDWAVNTFGNDGTVESIFVRAVMEFKELANEIFDKGDSIDTSRVGAEVADVVILLSQLMSHCGLSLQNEINKKMAINSMRTWIKTNDGVGQHV
jgi:NTP pyrophosphatase (non-canonical NTP hydrolase)